MNPMTENQARAEGLTVIELPPVAITPAHRAELSARLADQLAAAVDNLMQDPDLTHLQRAALDVVLEGLGALHVDCDVLGEELREVEAFGDLMGVA